MKNSLKKIIKGGIKVATAPFVLKDFKKYKEADERHRFSVELGDLNPQILDKTIKTGFDAHYVYHTSWAARKLKNINPDKHIDISSSLYFVGITSAFIDMDFYDYRPADLNLSGLHCYRGDLNKLPFEDNSIKSISCMHTIEHIGLGRYGDKIDPEGDIKAINELKRVTIKDGNILFVTPVGKERIEFNAHRIYALKTILELFGSDFKLHEFALVDDEHNFKDYQNNFDKEELARFIETQKYSCGCFWFKKIK